MYDIYMEVCSKIINNPNQIKSNYLKIFEKSFDKRGYCLNDIIDYLIELNVLKVTKVINGEYEFDVLQINLKEFLKFFEFKFQEDIYILILDYILKNPNKSKNTYIKNIEKEYKGFTKEVITNAIDYLLYDCAIYYKKLSYKGNSYTGIGTDLERITDFCSYFYKKK